MENDKNGQNRRDFLKKGAAAGAAALLAGTGLSSMSRSLLASTDTEKMALLMDHSLCVRCHACRVACQNENDFPNEANTIEIRDLETGNYPEVEYYTARFSCFHCRDAPCVEVCPVDAIKPDSRDLKVTDIEECIGCEACVDACPYGIPEMQDEKMYKCNGCVHLLENDEKPACVTTCPTHALSFGSQKEMAEQGLERIKQLEGEGKKGYLFGPEAQEGLGLMLILRTDPENFNLS